MKDTIVIVKEEGRQFVRELTLEYIKQNNLLCEENGSIPEQIDKIVEIENLINNCVENRYSDFKSL